MNANELRIGNLLENWYGDNYFEVTIEDLQIIYNGKSKAKPILLTEEWLLKFGFKKVAENDFILGKYSLYYLLYYDGYRVSEITPKYVHQLQNLYFALTGKELVVSDAVS